MTTRSVYVPEQNLHERGNYSKIKALGESKAGIAQRVASYLPSISRILSNLCKGRSRSIVNPDPGDVVCARRMQRDSRHCHAASCHGHYLYSVA